MTSKASSDKQTTPRRRLYKLHTWVGFHLAWVMSLVLLTGTFAVISHEIDWLVHDEMRVTPPSERPAIDWAALEAAARDHSPGDTLLTSLAFVLAISLYTGLKTTRKWGQAATRIRFGKSARVAVGDYHRAVGIWSIWFFVVMIITGLWYQWHLLKRLP